MAPLIHPRSARRVPIGRVRIRRTGHLLGVLVALTLLVSLLPGPPPASAEAPAGITGVRAAAETITITGSADPGKQVDLYAIGAETTASIDGAKPVAGPVADADGSFSQAIPRTAADGSDRLYAQFVAVQDGGQLGVGHFADDLVATPASSGQYPTAASKKGLQVQMTDDAEMLGVQHAGINLDLAEIMIKEPADEANTITFTHGGREYYFDRSAVEATDRSIKPLSDRGVLVNLIILLYQHPDDPNSAADVLIHPDAVVESGAGPVYGFNTVTAEGRRHLTAAMEFVASRWASPDSTHGRAVGYIVGNEVNAQWIWSNSGDIELEAFVDGYARALRLMSLAARKYFDQARTYVSLEHHWTIAPSTNPDPENPTRYYTGRALLEELNRQVTETGNFGWSVAYHPYPENLFEPDFWNDTTATNSLDTQRITFKNIQVLPQFLDSDAFRYQGEPRRIALTEQGCNTPGSGDALTAENERLQAACYAYAYYKVRFLPSIDSFILHRHVDHRLEGGLNLGLWAADYDSDSSAAPLRRKFSYDVFAGIDTERSLEVTEFAKDIIGIENWSDVIDGFDPEALAQRPTTTTVGGRSDVRLTGARPLSRFDHGTDGWRTADNVAQVNTDDGALSVRTASGTFANQWRGVVKTYDRPLTTGNQRWLAATLDVPQHSGLGREVVARFRVSTRSGATIQGDARVNVDQGQTTVAVRLPARSKITRIKIWLRGTGTADPAPTFEITSIDLARRASESGYPNVLLAAETDRAELDDATMQVRLTSLADTDRTSRIEFGGCGDFRLDPDAVTVDLEAGSTREIRASVTRATAEPSVLCVRVDGSRFTVPVTIPPPTPHPVYDFEDGVGGWQAGDNVSEVARVTSMPNAPGTPHGGDGALNAVSENVPADLPRAINVDAAEPIDLSAARTFYLWLNSYGGAPGASGYQYTLTLTAADGTSRRTEGELEPNTWNHVQLDVAGWSGREAVQRVEVTFAAVGSDTPWPAHFQIDDVGYFE